MRDPKRSRPTSRTERSWTPLGAALDLRRAAPIDEAGIVELLGGCTGMAAEGIVGRFGEVPDDPEGEAPEDVAIVVVRVRG